MVKYHIGKHNKPVICRAEINCRLGEHFTDLTKAMVYSDKINELEMTYFKIIKAEERITEELTQITKATQSKLVGLDFRVKALSSTKEKILVRKDAEKVTDLYDVIRYTSLSDPDNYQQTFTDTIKHLEDKGYKVVNVKNTWGGDGYKGINVKLETKNKTKFELQFHTPQSLEAKEVAHILYEEARLPTTSKERERELNARMNDIFNSIPLPKNIIVN